MTITAKIVADSLAPTGQRLTTMELRYPRFIHSEELTHRVLSSTPEMIEVVSPDGVMYDRNLSRNASSSRAIPVERLIKDVIDDPVYPSFWGKNEPGMQAREEHDAPVYLTGSSAVDRDAAWKSARDYAIMHAKAFSEAGYHKQIVNRLLEPFSHINVVVTATEWENFFDLRRHADAQPEIKLLADAMWEAMNESEPIVLGYDSWHTPYVREPVPQAQLISAARCARVSYKTHDGGEPDWDKDMRLSKQLIEGKHMSPFEHQARPLRDRWGKSGNFVGWCQFRQQLQ